MQAINLSEKLLWYYKEYNIRRKKIMHFILWTQSSPSFCPRRCWDRIFHEKFTGSKCNILTAGRVQLPSKGGARKPSKQHRRAESERRRPRKRPLPRQILRWSPFLVTDTSVHPISWELEIAEKQKRGKRAGEPVVFLPYLNPVCGRPS